jgi:hypothetical protein
VTWQEVRDAFPQRWLLVEAVQAHSEADHRILDGLAVVEQYGEDAGAAMRGYLGLHKQFPQRELYVLHTSRESLDIEERRWLGIRT